MDSGFHRRDFLRVSAVSAASYSRILGANDSIHVGLVGYGVRGQLLMEIFRQQHDVSLSAVCEVYGEQLDRAQQKAPAARGFTDHRKMLEMQELAAVVVATPDHWHCPIAIDAMNAGKDVYVENPLTLRIDEGLDVVKAAHINQRAYLDFGGGQITDLFTHWIDVLQWYTGENVPCAATAVGGIYTHKDGRTAPDTIHAALEYPGGYVAIFDGAVAAGERGSGGELIGTKGRLLFGPQRMEFHPAEKGVPPLIRDFPEEPTAAHVRDFLECMRIRRQPVADVLVGHRAARSAHLCNIAYLEQKRIRFDPVSERIIS